MLSDREKKDAWTKLASWINRLDSDLTDLSGEQKWYLRDACFRQKPVITTSGVRIGGIAQYWRKGIGDWAAYHAVQVFRSRGYSKTDAYKEAARHFGKSISRIREGVKNTRQLFREDSFNSEENVEHYKDRDPPPAYVLSNPDPDY